jgi:hypothetical protein
MEQSMAKTSSLIRGTSGATVRLRNAYVEKSSDSLVGQLFLSNQAAYMERHGKPFVEVTWKGDGAYSMPRLRPLQYRAPLAVLLHHARDSLRPLWARPAVPAADWAVALGHYINTLCATHALPHLKPALLAMLDRVAHRPGTMGSTHGDATLENAMRNEYEELVWIDPIPYRADIPPLIGVDLGKLLQSAYGYERVKYGADSEWCAPDERDPEVVLRGMSEDDVFSARFFHMLAYLRGLQYFTGPVLEHAYDMLEEYLNTRMTR